MGADSYGEHADLVIALALACWRARRGMNGFGAGDCPVLRDERRGVLREKRVVRPERASATGVEVRYGGDVARGGKQLREELMRAAFSAGALRVEVGERNPQRLRAVR